MPHPFDATLKDLVAQHRADFVPVFNLPQTTTVSALNVDLSTLTAATDVAFGFGQPLQEIVDLNFQSGPDPALAARLHLYNAALHFRFGVSVHSKAVLLRTKAEVEGLDGNLAYLSGGKRVEFEYDMVRMWQRPVEPFLHGGPGLLPLAPLCQMAPGKPLPEALREVVREIDSRLAQEVEHAQAVRLMTAAFILTGLRVPQKDLASIFSGVGIMQESAPYDVILDEGKIRQSHFLLLKQGKKRFGPPDSATESALTAIQDLARLEQMAEAVLTVSSWEELLATP